MKQFETPVAKVIELKSLDIVCTSGCPEDTSDLCPNDMGDF